MMPLDDAKPPQMAHLSRIVIKKYCKDRWKTLHLHPASWIFFSIFEG